MARIGVVASTPFASTRKLRGVNGEARMQLLKPRLRYAVMRLVPVWR
jgi:hypothetical protein